jgi:hypothetical protein
VELEGSGVGRGCPGMCTSSVNHRKLSVRDLLYELKFLMHLCII